MSYIDKVFNAGEMKISILTDARQERDASILVGDAALLAKIPKDFKMISTRNVILLEYKQYKILFDTGLGADKGGKLMDALKEINVSPSDITHVFITHMHNDHIGGLLFSGKPAFPNADIYVPKKEADWQFPNNYKSVNLSEVEQKYLNAVTIFQTLDKTDEEVYFFEGDNLSIESARKLSDDLNIFPVDAYGHTPGHTIYKIVTGKNEFLVWGDILHVIDIQLENPDISATYDNDPIKAADTRKKVLEYAAKNKIIVTGSHMENPGAFIIEKNKNGYIKKSF